jgi:hypothetical protein
MAFFGPSAVLKGLPPAQRAKFYDVLDKTGNFRVERLSFAYLHDAAPDKRRFIGRLTGKGNPAWLIAAMKEYRTGLEATQIQGDRDTPITVLKRPKNAPGDTTYVFVGETDLLTLDYVRPRAATKEFIDEILAVRGGKTANAATGALKPRLQKVPEKAVGFVVGELPEDMGREFKALLGVAPLRIDAFVEKAGPVLEARGVLAMSSTDEAQSAVMKLAKLRKEGIGALQQMLTQPDANPRLPVNSLITLLQGVEIESMEKELRLQAKVPENLLPPLPGWFVR